VKLLLDENISHVVAQQLRERGHDVVAVTERADLRGRPDAELFDWCQREGRVVATYDRDDFLELDRLRKAAGEDHAGIIILNVGAFPQRTGTIGRLVTSLSEFVETGAPYPSFVHWL
jgi:predicted nuclease of predicted toxin-antitoxin system